MKEEKKDITLTNKGSKSNEFSVSRVHKTDQEKSLSNKWLDYPELKTFSLKGLKNQGEYLKNGDDDRMPEFIDQLYFKSEDHKSMVNGYIDYINGRLWEKEGKSQAFLEFFKNDPMEEGRYKSPNLNKLLKLVSRDLKMYGSAYLQISWSRDGESIAKIHQQRWSEVRLPNEEQSGLKKYYISKKFGGKNYGKLPDDAKEIQEFSEVDGDKTKPQLLEIRMPFCEQYDYSLPDYFAAYRRIQLDSELAVMNLSYAQKGFMPSIVFSLPFTPPEEERTAAKNMLKETFGGSENSGEPMILWGADGIEVNSFAPESPDKLFEFQQQLLSNKIRAAHRVTRPELFGLTTYSSGGLNLNHSKDELLLAFELFSRTCIDPYQREIQEAFSRLGEVNGIEEDQFKILPFILFEESMNRNQEEAQNIASQGEAQADDVRSTQEIVEPNINDLLN